MAGNEVHGAGVPATGRWKDGKGPGQDDIEVRGPLTRGAMAEFRYLDKTEVGRIDRLERYNRSDKAPTVHIVQSQGE